MMRRLILAALVAASLTTTTPVSAQPLVQTRTTAPAVEKVISDGKRHVGPERVPSCRYRYLDGAPAFSKTEVYYTIRCAVERWPVPGGLDLATCIARRESGYNWFADNPTSSASGVYQFVDGTWAGEVSHFAEFLARQDASRSVWNARSNVLVAIRVAHTTWGWGPWGGRC